MISSYTQNPYSTSFTFVNSMPGTKTLYAKFIASDGTTQIFSNAIQLLNAPSPTNPLPTITPLLSPTNVPHTSGHMAVIMYAPWFTMSAFQSMVEGNLDGNDQIRYRVTNYPTGYDPNVVTALKAIKASVPGLKLGVDIAYSANIVQYAQQIKSEGFDFVEYDLESNFDGPNNDADAANNVAKIKAAANAVHAQGMTFRVTPGKPNTTSFERTGLLGSVAQLVDYYQIQAQTLQPSGSVAYSSFTDTATKILKTANPHIIVTSQVSPGQGAQTGETVQQTMEDDVTASLTQPIPGNTDGAGMWIGSNDVPIATSFFSWFHKQYP